MDNLYRKGELLQVHTKNCEIFEGQFYEITDDKSKISLYNVKETPQGNKSDGILHYYESEIQNIVKLKDLSLQTYLKITQEECESIIKISKKYIFINQIDASFHKALHDLNQHPYISVSSDGAKMARKCKMPFLVTATPYQIYIFDVFAMREDPFDAGLRQLLEQEHPKKVVHDCRKLSDCLYHKHRVKLQNLFDTQVADLIIAKNKNGCLRKTVGSLSECLNIYLGLQKNYIDDSYDIVQSTERPLPTKFKDTLAKNIAFLHRLSEVMNDELMLSFTRGVECYVESIRSCDDLKAWELCGKNNQTPKDFNTAIEY